MFSLSLLFFRFLLLFCHFVCFAITAPPPFSLSLAPKILSRQTALPSVLYVVLRLFLCATGPRSFTVSEVDVRSLLSPHPHIPCPACPLLLLLCKRRLPEAISSTLSYSSGLVHVVRTPSAPPSTFLWFVYKSYLPSLPVPTHSSCSLFVLVLLPKHGSFPPLPPTIQAPGG